NPDRLVVWPTQEDLSSNQSSRIDVRADSVQEIAIGLRRGRVGRVVFRYHQQCHGPRGIARYVWRQLRIECRQHFHTTDIYARRTQSDRLEIDGADQTVAVLQIARDLSLAVAHGFRLGSAPGRYGIADLESSGQRRTAIN